MYRIHPLRFFFDMRHQREMENISSGPTFGDFIRTEVSMQDVVQEYRLPFLPSFKCNVLRKSLSTDSQNIPCATLKRRGSWVISVHNSALKEGRKKIKTPRPAVELVIKKNHTHPPPPPQPQQKMTVSGYGLNPKSGRANKTHRTRIQ